MGALLHTAAHSFLLYSMCSICLSVFRQGKEEAMMMAKTSQLIKLVSLLTM